MKTDRSSRLDRPLHDADYAALAGFRRAIREFLAFSEGEARARGLTPQQHQAVLAIRGLGDAGGVTIRDLAEHLLIQHNSAVELVARLVSGGLVERKSSGSDRRRVLLTLTPKAHAVLDALSETHLLELRRRAPQLAELLGRLV